MNGKIFHKIPIGGKFHDGKSNGIGANSEIVSWMIFEKISKSQAREERGHGQFARHVGDVCAFAPASLVWEEV